MLFNANCSFIAAPLEDGEDMLGRNRCSPLWLEYIYKHNIVSYSPATKSNTEGGFCRSLQMLVQITSEIWISKWAVDSAQAPSSSRWQFTSPAGLKELKSLSIWCQIHSEECWRALILHALGIQEGLVCVHIATVQIQIISAPLCSHAHQMHNRKQKRMRSRI